MTLTCIDLFAGWGGFSEGAEQAGARVLWAANHWPMAVAAHARNHPGARHVCQDLRQADWSQLPDYELMLAAPACQGHSQASQPKRRRHHDKLRATAWSVVDCAEVTQPKALIVENVLDFRRWKLYPLWRQALELLGYDLTEHVLTATAFGVPQRRQRLFFVGTQRAGFRYQAPLMKVEPAIEPCLQFDADVPWTRVRDATSKVKERIAKGRRNHGGTFLTQHVTGHPGVPLNQAIRTVTTQDQWALVVGGHYRPLTVRETARAMGFPDTYGWPEGSTRGDQIKGLGNAVCPAVAADLVRAVHGHLRAAA